MNAPTKDLFETPRLDGFEFASFLRRRRAVAEPVFEAMGFTRVADGPRRALCAARAANQSDALQFYEPRSAAWVFPRPSTAPRLRAWPSGCAMAAAAYDHLTPRATRAGCG